MTSLTQRLHSPGKAFCSSVRYGGAFRHLLTYLTTSPFNPSHNYNHNDNSPGFSVSEVVFLSPFFLPPSLSSWLVFHPTSFDSEANSSSNEKGKSHAVVCRERFKITKTFLTLWQNSHFSQQHEHTVKDVRDENREHHKPRDIISMYHKLYEPTVNETHENRLKLFQLWDLEDLTLVLLAKVK